MEVWPGQAVHGMNGMNGLRAMNASWPSDLGSSSAVAEILVNELLHGRQGTSLWPLSRPYAVMHSGVWPVKGMACDLWVTELT